MTRLLIVDDDSDIRFLLRSILESYGYHCDEAGNGLEALEMIEHQDYALILLDYSMPFMNGLVLTRRLSETSWITRHPVIMMTANSDEGLRKQALEAGVSVVLSKPFDLDYVLFTIERTLKKRPIASPCYHDSP